MQREKINKAIDETFVEKQNEEFGYREILTTLRALFPEEIARVAEAKMNAGLLAEIKLEIRRRHDSDDPKTDNRNLQDQLCLDFLPGMDAPRFLTYPGPDGKDRIKIYSAATRVHLNKHDRKLAKNIEYAMKKRQDHQLKMQFLRPYMADNLTTVQEAIERYQDQMDGDDDHPSMTTHP